jgi:hypothetical protein
MGVERGWAVWDFQMGFPFGLERLRLLIRGGLGCLAVWVSRAAEIWVLSVVVSFAVWLSTVVVWDFLVWCLFGFANLLRFRLVFEQQGC